MKLRRYTIGIIIYLLQAVLVFNNAHGYSTNQLTYDSDYFVRPVAETTGLVYSGRYYPQQRDSSWKWIALDEYNSLRFQGAVIIYRYDCSNFQQSGNPKHHHHHSSFSGRRRLVLTLESWRIDAHQSFRRPLCSGYRYIARPRLKKLSLRRGSIRYTIYYRGHAEIHEDKKTEHPVKPKPKPKRKRKQLEQHSRKRSHTKNEKFEPRDRKKERRRPQCGVSAHQ